jgi:hypothetical protein
MLEIKKKIAVPKSNQGRNLLFRSPRGDSEEVFEVFKGSLLVAEVGLKIRGNCLARVPVWLGQL